MINNLFGNCVNLSLKSIYSALTCIAHFIYYLK